MFKEKTGSDKRKGISMIRHILFDVDSTLSLAPVKGEDYFWTIIERLLLERTGGGYTEVYPLMNRKLKKLEFKGGDNEPVEIAGRLSISEEKLWRAAGKWMSEYVRPVPEALPAVKALINRGFICRMQSGGLNRNPAY